MRALPGSWDPDRDELRASLVTGGGELPGASVQRLAKRKWCNLAKNGNINVSMVI